jgi:hypothetical protein
MEMNAVVNPTWYVARPIAPTGFPLQGSGVSAGRPGARLRGLRGIGLRGATASELDSLTRIIPV